MNIKSQSSVLLCVMIHFGSASLALQPQSEPETEAGPSSEFLLVEGQITDAIGAGQAQVTVTAHRKKPDGKLGEPIATSSTDRLGDFRLTSADPIVGKIVVTLSKPLYDDLVREFTLSPDAWPPFMAESMEGNVVVIGKVVDHITDKVLPGASVTLKASERDWMTESNEKGEFQLKGVLPGEGSIIVEAKGYGRERQRVMRLEDFGELVVRVKPERVLHVQIVDEVDHPIQHATVEILDERRNDLRTAVTDKSGTVRFGGLHFDTVSVSVRLTHASHASDTAFDREITTKEGQIESTHRLVMHRAGGIRGIVLEADTNSPLYGARIMTGTGDTSPRDWADFEGKYEINGVMPGPVVLTVHMAGYAPLLRRTKVKSGETVDLEFKLSKGATVSGTIKDEQGEPINGAFVDATKWRGESTLGLRTISDRQGRFVFDSAPHDPFEVTAYAREYGRVIVNIDPQNKNPIVITLPERPAPGEGFVGSKITVGNKVPSVTLTTIQGKKIVLAELKDKVVFVDFWATWCGPCVADIPQLRKTFEAFGKRNDFVMISVSLDEDESALQKFVKKKEMSWHQVVGEKGGATAAADGFGVQGIPAVFLIGKNGKIVARHLLSDNFIKATQRTLKGKASGGK